MDTTGTQAPEHRQGQAHLRRTSTTSAAGRSHVLRALAWLMLVAASVACGGGSAGTTPTDGLDVAGLDVPDDLAGVDVAGLDVDVAGVDIAGLELPGTDAGAVDAEDVQAGDIADAVDQDATADDAADTGSGGTDATTAGDTADAGPDDTGAVDAGLSVDADVAGDVPSATDAGTSADASADDTADAGCTSNGQCTGGVCVNGTCVAVVCTPADVTCTDTATLSTCNVTGTAWEPSACGADKVCSGGACQTMVCTPGAITCENAARLQCAPDGLSWLALPCGNSETCVQSACKPVVCTPGALICDGLIAKQCDAQGVGYDASEDCTNFTGGCKDGACYNWTCTPNATTCLSPDTREDCAADGTGWTPTPCENGTACWNGACLPTVCLPGQVSCSDSEQALACDHNGTTFIVTASCAASSEVCLNGACVACKPGAHQCNGKTLSTCDGTGQWVAADCTDDNKCTQEGCDAIAGTCTYDGIDCGDGNPCTADSCDAVEGCLNVPQSGSCNGTNVCSAGQCVKPTCQIGDTICSGTSLQTCRADQLGWTLSTCDGANACKDNQCKAKVCVPDSEFCQGDQIWVCDTTGFAPELFTDCTTFQGKWGCYGGTCVQQVCAPSSVTCASSTIVSSCKPDGSGYTIALCGAGTGCLDGECKPVICTAGETLCLHDQLVTCNNGGTSSTVVQDCAGDGKICSNQACKTCIPGGTTCVGGQLLICNNQGTGTSPFSCDDGDACTLDTCAGDPPLCAHTPNTCDDGNACTNDLCATTSGCTHAPKPGTCDDGSACTTGDNCVGTACVASSVAATVAPGIGSGVAGSVDGTGSAGQVNAPQAMCVLPDGTIVVADTAGHRIRKITGTSIATLAGTGVAGSLDGALGTATFNGPRGVACAADGSIYVADTGGNRLRKITASAVASVAGGGVAGFTDGVGAAAKFSGPTQITIDPAGSLIVADTGNNAIRRVTTGGAVSTLIGAAGSGMADGPAYLARVQSPTGLAFDPDGNLYIADTGNHRIRALAPGGVVSTTFGSGVAGYSEANGAAGQVSGPTGLAWSNAGFLVVADTGNHRIRAVWSNGTNAPIVGSGVSGFAEGAGATAQFASPSAVAVLASSGIVVADTKNNRVRFIGSNTLTCDDGKPCTTDACDPLSGQCVYTNIGTGEACTDGNRCTNGDACDAGGKCVGKTVNCDDGNVCTDDGCDKYTGSCTTFFNGASCTDSNPCTTGAKCAGGVCGVPNNCDDGDICTADSCNASGCVHAAIAGCCANDGACADNSTCTADKCTITCDGTLSGSSCYKGFTGAADWATALNACAAWGGTLATAGTSAENAIIAGVGATVGSGSEFWIGLTDSASEGTFAWVDGSATAFTNWLTGEPNNLTTLCGPTGEDVVVMNAAGKWADRCALDPRAAWVCEKAVGPGTCSHTVVGQCCTKASECDDGNACTTDKCDLGGCTHTPTPDGGSCGNSAFCSAGACLVGCTVGTDCVVGNECTVAAGAPAMCQTFADDFGGVSGQWAFVGTAKLDTPGAQVILTTSAKNNIGMAWYKTPLDFHDIEIAWSQRASNPGNPASDGWGVVFQDGSDTTKIGGGGSSVGMTGLVGLGVRFAHRGSGMSVSVQRLTAAGTSELICGTQGPNFTTSADRAVVVRVVAGKLRLTIDGTAYLNCDVRKDLPTSAGLLGFSAATGAEYAQHMIDNVVLRAPCVAKTDAVCTPVTCGDGYVSGQYEQCDDGNTANGDGCTSACAYELDGAWNTYQQTTLSLGTTEVPQQAHFGSYQGKTLDGTSLVTAATANTVIGLRSWANVVSQKTLSFTAGHDDNAALYIDNKLIASASYGNTLTVNTTLQPGWHKVEWLLYNASGAASLTPSKKLATLVDGLSSGPK